VMRCVLRCLLEVLKALDTEGVGGDALCATVYAGDAGCTGDDAMCALCMLEAVDGRLYLLECWMRWMRCVVCYSVCGRLSRVGSGRGVERREDRR